MNIIIVRLCGDALACQKMAKVLYLSFSFESSVALVKSHLQFFFCCDLKGAYTTHQMVVRMALTSYDQIPDKLAEYCYVEYTMPQTVVSHTTIRSVSVQDSDSDDPPEKYVRYLSRYEYQCVLFSTLFYSDFNANRLINFIFAQSWHRIHSRSRSESISSSNLCEERIAKRGEESPRTLTRSQ